MNALVRDQSPTRPALPFVDNGLFLVTGHHPRFGGHDNLTCPATKNRIGLRVVQWKSDRVVGAFEPVRGVPLNICRAAHEIGASAFSGVEVKKVNRISTTNFFSALSVYARRLLHMFDRIVFAHVEGIIGADQ